MFESFYGTFMEKICSKALQNYSASSWTSNFSICLWENIFRDIRISGRVPDSQNQLFFLWRDRDTSNVSRQNRSFNNYYFLKSLEIEHLKLGAKTGLGNPDGPSKKFLEILDMGSLSSRKHDIKNE